MRKLHQVSGSLLYALLSLSVHAADQLLSTQDVNRPSITFHDSVGEPGPFMGPDVCGNIQGYQGSVPDGYTLSNGSCLLTAVAVPPVTMAAPVSTYNASQFSARYGYYYWDSGESDGMYFDSPIFLEVVNNTGEALTVNEVSWRALEYPHATTDGYVVGVSTPINYHYQSGIRGWATNPFASVTLPRNSGMLSLPWGAGRSVASLTGAQQYGAVELIISLSNGQFITVRPSSNGSSLGFLESGTSGYPTGCCLYRKSATVMVN